MPDAFYLRDGENFVPTPLTRGPWDKDTQHGGPPAALLATLVERRHPRPEMQVVRVTVEILGPLPIAPMSVTTALLRTGRSVELLSGSLHAGGKEVLRATVMRIRTLPTDRTDAAIPHAAAAAPAVPPAPQAGGPLMLPSSPWGHDVGYHTAMECSFLRGGLFVIGPSTVWMRMRHPLIHGEETLPLARVLIAADSGNGVSAALDYRRWLFINPDLTVYLHRLPQGEWVCLDASTAVEPHGVGLAQTVLFDEQGVIGRGMQGLFIGERQPSGGHRGPA